MCILFRLEPADSCIMNFKNTSISNVSEYLKWVKDTFTSESEGILFEQTKVYYRGQSDIAWELKPKVFREYKKESGLILNESRLLKSASLRLWSEMSIFHTYLEKLIYLQHYGLGTRLLDVTFNPLIALYMACAEKKGDEENEGKDGAVYCGYRIEHDDPVIAEYSAEYLFTTGQTAIDFLDIESYAQKHKISTSLFAASHFIFPPINNPRIEAQNGAFIMPSLVNSDRKDGYMANSNKLDDSGFFDEKRAVINKDCKEEILRELSLLGINVGTIYKGVAEKLQAIQQEEYWRISKYKVDPTL